MPLSDAEKNRAKYHLGYLAASPNAASLQLGLPRPQQVLFVVEDALGLLSEDACTNVRRLMGIMDTIETQMAGAIVRYQAEQVDEIKLRGAKAGEMESDMLEHDYRLWGGRLADVLGVPFYPYSNRYKGGGPGYAGPVTVSK